MTDKRKVLLAIEELSVGGAERIVIELANRLDRSVWEPHVLCLAKPGVLAAEVEHAPVHCLDKRPGLDFSLPAKIRALVEKIRPDLVNSHLWTANTWLRWSLGNSVPTVITEHNCDTWKHFHNRFIDRRLLRVTAGIIAVSEQVSEFYQPHLGIDADRLNVIYNGVNPAAYAAGEGWRVRSELGIPEDALVAGYVGRLEEQKNPWRLLEAFKLILAEFPEAKLLIGGDGSLYKPLEKAAQQGQLRGKVFFAGQRTDVADVLASLDVFVLPSDREGHPLVVMEAQVAGIPAVVTDAGGAPKAVAIDGAACGGVVVEKSAAAVAAATAALFQDREKRRAMGEFARAYASEHFDISLMVREYARVFSAILERGAWVKPEPA